MDIKQSMRDILAAESRAIANIPVTDGYEQAVKLIVEQVKNRGGKLVTSGMGKCGQIAENIATTFSSTGIPAVFLHPSEAQHGDLGVLQQNDVMLLLSNSGRTSEILALVAIAGFVLFFQYGCYIHIVCRMEVLCLDTCHDLEVVEVKAFSGSSPAVIDQD